MNVTPAPHRVNVVRLRIGGEPIWGWWCHARGDIHDSGSKPTHHAALADALAHLDHAHR